MFIGHLALAFAAKRVAPALSLRTAMVASMLPDVIWPVLVLTGTEQVEIAPGDTAFAPLRFVSYPWSHSLLMVALAGAAFGLVHARLFRQRSAGIAIALLAVSHWLLDWITHRPDLPLVPGGDPHGLGLWNSVPATLVVELSLFVLGVALYAGATQARTRTGIFSFWSLVVVLGAVYIADRFNPPPPSVPVVAWAGLVLGAVLFGWATWIEHTRTGREQVIRPA